MTNRLIRCGDHSLAPSALTCVHICDGTATSVMPIPQEEGNEIEYDWLCSNCFDKHLFNAHGTVDDLRIVCIHCLREILKQYRDDSPRVLPKP